MAKPVWTTDQIVDNLNRNGEFWSGNTISYSFATTMPFEYNGLGLSFSSFNASQRAAASEAMKMWDDVMAVSLVETSGPNGDIQMFNSNLTEVAGAFLPNTVVEGLDVSGDVHFNPNYYYNSQLSLDDYGFMTMVHEIGHALGLEHPGEYNAGSGGPITYSNSAEYAQDTLKYTVMSYFGANYSGADHFNGDEKFAASPLLHDIAAVQDVYGADMTTRTGDTTYGFNSTAGRDAFNFNVNSNPIVAIWDAGGTDTLDFSGFISATTMDLREGGFSSTGALNNNVAIAFGAKIENAVGGWGNDEIYGNGLSNYIRGNHGDDRIEGFAGSDYLFGGVGNDHLIGGADDDTLYGEHGNDTLEGGSGNDSLLGIFGSNSLSGGSGDDYLVGADEADFLDGGSGHDDLNGRDGDDRLFGSTGNDSLLGGDGNDTLLGGADNDSLLGGEGQDSLNGEAGLDYLSGGAGDDTLKGGFGADSLEGGEGNDILDGGHAGDVAPADIPLHDDVAIFRGSRADYEITRDFRGDFTITDLYAADGDDGTDFLSNVEWFQFNDQRVDASTFEIPDAPDLVINGTDGIDTLSGFTGNDTLYGLAGNDVLLGKEGDDLLEGGEGNDNLDGDEGDDLLWGGAGNDQLFGELGNDRLFGEDGDDWLVGGHGNDTLNGGIGDDQLQGQYGSNLIIGGAGNDLLVGAEGSDTLLGGIGVDTLFGQSGADSLDGGEGVDTIWGGTGNDQLFGDEGNDTLHGEQGADTFHGGEGDDWIDGESSGTDDLVLYDGNFADYEIARDHLGGTTVTDLNAADGDEGTDYVEGVARLRFLDQEIFTGDLEIPPAPNQTLHGNEASNLLQGDAGNDTLYGYGGNDSLFGGAGIDSLFGGNDNDYLSGADGNDLLSGDAGADTLYGLSDNDSLLGGAGNDLMFGGDNDDVLVGGLGDDSIHGGNGNDTASFGGKRSDYWLTPNAGGYITVEYVGTDPAAFGGTDRVYSSTERFAFSDGTWLTADLPENITPPVYAVASSRGSKLTGGDGDDTLIGRGGRDKMIGGEGDDLLIGGGSRDKMIGGEGNDSIYGGSGTDKIAAGAGDDYIDGGKHNDKVAAGDGNDTIFGGKGIDKLIGEAGDDYIDGGKDKDKIAAGEGNDTVFGGKGTDKIAGQEGDDYIDGGKHNDKISGGAGNDTLIGGHGKDKVFGGEGNDVYIIDGKDRIGEAAGEGIDTVLANFSYSLLSEFENLVLTGESAIDGYGNSADNVLTGNNANNLLSGGAGSDTLMGGEGDDFLIGGDDADSFDFSLLVDSGSDTIGDFDRSADILRFSDVVDGAGDDIADLDAEIASIVNEGDGGDVRIDFNNGNSITFDDLGSGIAGNFGSIADVVDDASTQIVVTDLVGMAGYGFITQETQSNELSDEFTIVDRV